MAQQPNIELTEKERPRPEPAPGPPPRWTPSRPGDLEGPQDMRWGGAFGRPGPDTGWAQRLSEERPLDVPEGENPTLVRALIAAVAAARASYFGRAPVTADIDFAVLLLGLNPEELPAELVERVGEGRRRWLREAAGEVTKGQGLLAALGPDVLKLTAAELRHRMIVEARAGDG